MGDVAHVKGLCEAKHFSPDIADTHGSHGLSDDTDSHEAATHCPSFGALPRNPVLLHQFARQSQHHRNDCHRHRPPHPIRSRHQRDVIVGTPLHIYRIETHPETCEYTQLPL